jgi:acetyl-CoA synthetase
MEIESALVANQNVAESAVVSVPHSIKGESIVAFVVLKSTSNFISEELCINELQSWVTAEIGAIAKPDTIYLVENLPKTRSGKIMRRLLRSVVRGEPIGGDISTLENPAILEQIINKCTKKS